MRLTKTAVIDRVLQTLGLPEAPTTITAQQIALPESPLPCIRLKSGERKGWQVVLDGVSLEGKNGQGTARNPYIQRLVVTLCSRTGQVMEVRSPEPEDDPSLPPLYDLQSYEQALRSTSVWFTGLPDSPPKVTLSEALQKISSSVAKQIVAYYVIEKKTTPELGYIMDGLTDDEIKERLEKPLWIVHLRGIPGFVPPAPRGFEEEEPIRSMRWRIDALTGEVYTGDNFWAASSQALSESWEIKRKYDGRIITGNTGNDCVQYAAMMQQLLEEWDPVGHTAEEVEFVIGRPYRPASDRLVYRFDSGYNGVEWSLWLKDGKIVKIEKDFME